MYIFAHDRLQACLTLRRHAAEVVYLQYGGVYYCGQNDVLVNIRGPILHMSALETRVIYPPP